MNAGVMVDYNFETVYSVRDVGEVEPLTVEYIRVLVGPTTLYA